MSSSCLPRRASTPPSSPLLEWLWECGLLCSRGFFWRAVSLDWVTEALNSAPRTFSSFSFLGLLPSEGRCSSFFIMSFEAFLSQVPDPHKLLKMELFWVTKEPLILLVALPMNQAAFFLLAGNKQNPVHISRAVLKEYSPDCYLCTGTTHKA